VIKKFHRRKRDFSRDCSVDNFNGSYGGWDVIPGPKELREEHTQVVKYQLILPFKKDKVCRGKIFVIFKHLWLIRSMRFQAMSLMLLVGQYYRFIMYPFNTDIINRNLYRMYLSISILMFCGYPFFSACQNQKRTEVGSHVPEFTLADQNGNLFSINSVIGKKNLVIYFYPKDDTPGCTDEACYFRDELEAFSKADALIIGISGQSAESHKKFAEKYHLGFTLLSDEGDKVRKLFGVPVNFLGMLPGRVTYVADKSGTVVYIYNSQMKARSHVDEALKILNDLK
jgi:thioredoxin-dependent peroxiredoxin